MADTKLSALSQISVIDLDDELYGIDDPNGTPVSNAFIVRRLMGMLMPNPGGRLTLTTAVPVTTADVTAAGTLFYTPYLHNLIRVYDGTRWLLKTFSEISFSASGTVGQIKDVFVDDDAATLTQSAAWTNDTTRADALAVQDGVTVLDSDHTKLWLGTVRYTGTNTLEDSGGGGTTQVGGKRFVWNAYNRVPRWMRVIDTADNWSYTTATIRVADGATAPLNCVEYVSGMAGTRVSAQVDATAYCLESGSAGSIGVGVDSSSAYSGLRRGLFNAFSLAGVYIASGGAFTGYPGLGYHFISWLEKGANGTACLFLGDNGGDGPQSGMHVEIEA